MVAQSKLTVPTYEYVLIRGKIHKDSPFDENYYGIHLRGNELRHIRKYLKKRPVALNHQYEYGAIGEVYKTRIDKNGDLIVNLIVTAETEGGAEAIRGLMSGEYRSLSLGTATDLSDADPLGLCEEIAPFEVSICAVPFRTGCNIEGFAHSNGNLYVFEKWDKVAVGKSFEDFCEQNKELMETGDEVFDDSDDEEEGEYEKYNFASSRIVPFSKLQIHNQKTNSVIQASALTNSLSVIGSNSTLKRRMSNPEHVANFVTSGGQTIALTQGDLNQMIELDPRYQEVKKKVKFSTPDELFSANVIAADARIQDEAAELVQLDAKIDNFCDSHNAKGLQKTQLKTMDKTAKLILCNAFGTVEEIEKSTEAKQGTIKHQFQVMTTNQTEAAAKMDAMEKKSIATDAENAALKKKVEDLEAMVLKSQQAPAQGGNFQSQGARFGQQATTGVVTKINSVPLPVPPNTMVNASGVPNVPYTRERGLVPVRQEPSCFDTGYTTALADPAHSFASYLKASIGRPTVEVKASHMRQ